MNEGDLAMIIRRTQALVFATINPRFTQNKEEQQSNQEQKTQRQNNHRSNNNSNADDSGINTNDNFNTRQQNNRRILRLDNRPQVEVVSQLWEQLAIQLTSYTIEYN